MTPALPPWLRAAGPGTSIAGAAVPGTSCAVPQVPPGAAAVLLAPVTTIAQTAAPAATLITAERRVSCIMNTPGCWLRTGKANASTLTQVPGDGKAFRSVRGNV